MGGRGSSSGSGNGTGVGGGGGTFIMPSAADAPQITIDAAAAQQANNANFSATDDSDFHALYNGRQYYQNQSMDIDAQIACMNYVAPDTENGSLYSMSQNMNWNLVNGIPLTANQKYVYNSMMSAMHNLGYNVYLYRYDHDTQLNSLLKQYGLNGAYDSYSAAQLKNVLVGKTFTENKMISTSYNDFAKAADASVFTGRTVKIVYQAKAGTQALMVGNAPMPRGYSGSAKYNALGEVVLAPKQQQRIVDVRFNGKSARSQGTQYYNRKQIEIVVEIG